MIRSERRRTWPLQPRPYVLIAADLFFLLIDLTGIADLMEGLQVLVLGKIRPLSTNELAIGRSVFGETIRWDRVLVRPDTLLGFPKGVAAYVRMNTICFRTPFDDPLLVHELVHVWQYQRFGLCYIPRCLFAQRSKRGYDYGGNTILQYLVERRWSLGIYNFEQQARIAEEAYRLSAQPTVKKSEVVPRAPSLFLSEFLKKKPDGC